MYETLRLECSDAIATLTLNRPEKLNAYTPQMGEDLVHAFRAVQGDAEVRCVVLTGEGRGFCAGVDLAALKAMQSGKAAGPGPQLGEEEFVKGFALELFEYPKPVIAAINGAAIGVGVTMALPCDVRIASSTAKLGLTFAKLGILPGLGSTHLLPWIVGLAKAQELVGMPVGQVVGRLNAEVSSADVIYQFMDEFVESVERLQKTLEAASTT